MTTGQTPAAEAETLAAIQAAAMDYAQGWYEGDAERMARALSPELVKRAFVRDGRTGAERLSQLDRAWMVAKTQQGGGTADAPGKPRTYAVAVLDVYGDIACARAETVEYVDYLQLARREGRWVIVNVLWAYKPASP